MDKKSIKHCKDCLAYYSEEFNHVCPPWLKQLVVMNKNKKTNPHPKEEGG